ncbi:MAG: hypothetical protein JW940_39530 [Polyangiaceae bacterium]|nr:hypothetical protein [Polyangiaceae bacterium]
MRHYPVGRHLPLVASLCCAVASVAIVLLRVGYPRHGYWGLAVYLVGWVLLGWAAWRYRVTRRGAEATVGLVRRHLGALSVAFGLLASGYLLYVLFPVKQLDFVELDPTELGGLIERDLAAAAELTLADERGYLGSAKTAGLRRRPFAELSPADRAELLGWWAAMVDRTVALETLVLRHRSFYQINYVRHPEANLRSFLIGYASLVANLKAGFALRSEVRNNPTLGVVLNDARPELGIPARAYSRIDRGLDSPETAILLHAGRTHLTFAKKSGKLGAPREARLIEYAEDTYARLVKQIGKAPRLVLESPLSFYQETTVKFWFPLQKGISEAMGDLRTTRRPSLISDQQVRETRSRLEPGDIILERRNWYLSNLGLPGFWPHAALYTGDLSELDAYFQGADKLEGKSFSSWLSEHLPRAYAGYHDNGSAGHLPSVVEAVSEGVIQHEFEVSGAADYLAILRPRLERSRKLDAVLTALSYLGRPYDFDFDFLTDSSLVCSEVVVKAYEPRDNLPGLHFQLGLTAGRLVVSPTDIATTFDRQYQTPEQQLDFVAFLDGVEATKSAVSRDVVAFRQSVHRPKWDIAQE